MTSSPPLSTAEAVESIKRSLSDLNNKINNQDFFENPCRFCGYVLLLQLLLNTLIRTSFSPYARPPSVQTDLKGIAGDVAEALETVLVYRNKSKFFVLTDYISLSDTLQECTTATGAWLALTETSLHHHPELRQKIVYLSRDMKETFFKVTGMKSVCTLQKEGEGRETAKAVQSAIVMDLMRTLGIKSDDLTELTEQIKQLRTDFARSISISKRRILSSLQRLLDSWYITFRI